MMIRDFFINNVVKTERRSVLFRPAGTDSSTEKRASSRAGARRKSLGRRGAVAIGWAYGLLSLATTPAAISLSHAETLQIGRKIWQNECGGTISGLTSWNAGEDFASLGIGHFIWYPKGRQGPFEESFPRFLGFAQQRGTKLPGHLSPNDRCLWSSRADFLAAKKSAQMTELRQFLARTVDLQAEFLALRLVEAGPKIAAAAPTSARAKVEKSFNRLEGSARGDYALIDYVNFKGEGLLPSERYDGRGWGLLQVLEEMSEGGDATLAFAEAAATVLRERVRNAPPARHEARWLPGWLNRIATYR